MALPFSLTIRLIIELFRETDEVLGRERGGTKWEREREIKVQRDVK